MGSSRDLFWGFEMVSFQWFLWVVFWNWGHSAFWIENAFICIFNMQMHFAKCNIFKMQNAFKSILHFESKTQDALKVKDLMVKFCCRPRLTFELIYEAIDFPDFYWHFLFFRPDVSRCTNDSAVALDRKCVLPTTKANSADVDVDAVKFSSKNEWSIISDELCII